MDRLIRPQWLRCMLAAVMIPILILGAFGGTTFLVHAHDGHDWHLHASSSVEEARHAAEQHLLAHASGHATCGDHASGHHGPAESGEVPSDSSEDPEFPRPSDESGELVITIPDHEQLAPRGIDLSQAFQTAEMVQCILAWFCAQPDIIEEMGSPGGRLHDRFAGSPLHLAALTAGRRLVRTSNALLI